MTHIERQKLAALERAIKAAGGVGALAKRLKKHQTLVSQWKRRKQVPSHWVLLVESETGVPCHELRPDLYRKPAAVAA